MNLRNLKTVLALTILISCQSNNEQTKNQKDQVQIEKDSTLKELLASTTKTQPLDTNSFCDWDISRCSLPKDDEAHFDPYYNGHLCENFDPKQVDFSSAYLELQEAHTRKYGVDVTNDLSSYTYILDSLFNHGDFQNNGVIGSDYTRIRVHIDKTKQMNNRKFQLMGQTNVRGNVCNFSGILEVYKIYEYKENFDYPGQATLFARYQFNEDSNQKHVGTFKGTFECSILINHTDQTIRLDEGMFSADGYHNRTFVGTWTPYNSTKSKKCIWGDNRLPFTFDFDQGDGEMYINKKYAQNGWEPFINRTEYTIIDGERQLKDVWWK